jgi:hypothetical protein
MPNFRFTVLTEDGKVRKGRLTADSTNVALQMIAAQGFKLVDLEDLSESSLVIKSAPEAFRGLSFDAPDQLEYRPGLWERLAAGRLSDKTLGSVVGLFVIVALIMFAFEKPWVGGGSGQATAGPTQVRVEGSLAATPPPGSKLALSLPGVPLREFYEPAKVAGANGAYVLEMEFRSPRQAATAEVLLIAEGKTVARSGAFPLRGAPLRGQAPVLSMR